MRYYFTLQFTMLNRHINDFGLKPIVGWLLLSVAFLGLSAFLFANTEYAPYIYVFLSGFYVMKLSETKRNDFLKRCFPNRDYGLVRMYENVIVAIPFVAFLLVQTEWIFAIALLVIAGSLALMNFNTKLNVTIPTPFSRRPFEFVVGFRKTFLVFFAAWYMTYQAVRVANFDLGIMAMILVLFTCLSYYSESESEYEVWMHALTPGGFLFSKVKTASLFATILCLPMVVSMVLLFPDKKYAILGLLVLGICYLVTMIFAKYATFPEKMSLPQSALITISLFFPPLLFAIGPFFYVQSIKKLNRIL